MRRLASCNSRNTVKASSCFHEVLSTRSLSSPRSRNSRVTSVGWLVERYNGRASDVNAPADRSGDHGLGRVVRQ
jgi:hypothetical protein